MCKCQLVTGVRNLECSLSMSFLPPIAIIYFYFLQKARVKLSVPDRWGRWLIEGEEVGET